MEFPFDENFTLGDFFNLVLILEDPTPQNPIPKNPTAEEELDDDNGLPPLYDEFGRILCQACFDQSKSKGPPKLLYLEGKRLKSHVADAHPNLKVPCNGGFGCVNSYATKKKMDIHKALFEHKSEYFYFSLMIGLKN